MLDILATIKFKYLTFYILTKLLTTKPLSTLCHYFTFPSLLPLKDELFYNGGLDANWVKSAFFRRLTSHSYGIFNFWKLHVASTSEFP